MSRLLGDVTVANPASTGGIRAWNVAHEARAIFSGHVLDHQMTPGMFVDVPPAAISNPVASHAILSTTYRAYLRSRHSRNQSPRPLSPHPQTHFPEPRNPEPRRPKPRKPCQVVNAAVDDDPDAFSRVVLRHLRKHCRREGSIGMRGV